VKLVALKVGSVKLQGGADTKADGQLHGTPSIVFDAVAVVLSAEAAGKLAKEAAAVQWVMDAYGHLKAIGSNADAKPLLDKAGVVPDAGIVAAKGGEFVAAAKRRYFDREPSLRTLA
jgi:catalase